jgi:hypothetical protein
MERVFCLHYPPNYAFQITGTTKKYCQVFSKRLSSIVAPNIASDIDGVFAARAPWDFPSTYPGFPLPISHAILEAFLQPEPHGIFRAPILNFPCQYCMQYWRRFCSSSSHGIFRASIAGFAANMVCDIAGGFSP